MDLADLRQIAKWLDAAGIRSIEIDGPGTRMRMVMADAKDDVSNIAMTAESPCENVEQVAAVAEMPGVFLATHPVRSGPVVSPGDRVRQGDIVGLLRIGRLLSPVTAPEDGVVTGIAAAPGTPVDFGTRLVSIRPSASDPAKTGKEP